MKLYRWVPLKLEFLGAWKSVRLKHYLAYPIIIISLILQRNLATKIWAKRESGLTAVWLKRDPPVYRLFKHFNIFLKFAKYDLFSTLQALYICIMLIMPHATCEKRESVKKLGTFWYKWVKSLNFTTEKSDKVEVSNIQGKYYCQSEIFGNKGFVW